MSTPEGTTETLTIGRMLKLLRTVEGISAKALGEKIGFSASYISELENGKKEPTIRVLNAYSKYFGISAGGLLDIQEIGLRGSNAEMVLQMFEEIAAAETKRSSGKPASTESTADVLLSA